jgi:hypothetical protein
MNSYSLSDFRIYYVNLEERKDRRESIENELKKLELTNFTRVNAVYGKKLPKKERDFWCQRKNFFTFAKEPNRILGRVGCLLSHLNTLELALKEWEKYKKPILILEDDCKFLIEKDIEFFIPNDCDIFYLGGLYWYTDDNIHCTNYYDPFINIKMPLKIACTFSYILLDKERIQNLYDTINDNYKRSLDMMYCNLVQSKGKCYIINPPLTIQGDMFTSDVSDEGEETPSAPYKHNFFLNSYAWTPDMVKNYYKKPYRLPKMQIIIDDLKYLSEKAIKISPNKLIENSFLKSIEKLKESDLKSLNDQFYILGIFYLNAILEQIGRFLKKKYNLSQLNQKHINLIKKAIVPITEKLLKSKLPKPLKNGIKDSLKYYLN